MGGGGGGAKGPEDESDISTSIDRPASLGYRYESWSSPPPPNVFLNVSGGPVPQVELVFIAVLGVLIQSAVLVYDCLITLRVDGWMESPPPPYALPLTMIGTIGVSLGSFICASVVDAGTDEETWGPRWSTDVFQTMWVQRGQTVGDQAFGSFALSGPPDQRVVKTSHKMPTPARLQWQVLIGATMTIACISTAQLQFKNTLCMGVRVLNVF